MIKPNASRDELDSPFFLKNEEICKEWEIFALSNKGNISGTYNSWSYKLFIKIDQKPPCRITVSKATYTSGNLLISSKIQNLQENIVVKLKTTQTGSFEIKRSSWWELLFTRKVTRALNANPYYTIIGEKNQDIFKEIIPILKPLFKTKQVLDVTLEDTILTIRLNYSNREFDLIQSIICSSIS